MNCTLDSVEAAQYPDATWLYDKAALRAEVKRSTRHAKMRVWVYDRRELIAICALLSVVTTMMLWLAVAVVLNLSR